MKNTMKNTKWEISLMGNQILERGNYYISFRKYTTRFGDSFAGDDNGLGETAICYDGEFAILNGDFRKEYEELDTLEECLEFYEIKKAESKSKWSTV
jgi:hypothetical protein